MRNEPSVARLAVAIIAHPLGATNTRIGLAAQAGGRLPTETEREYAARAGSTAARYGNLCRWAKRITT